MYGPPWITEHPDYWREEEEPEEEEPEEEEPEEEEES